MASATNPLSGASSSSASSASSSSASSLASAPSEEVFLQLLVAQIQNQDPLNPTDSTQFVSQLAQFSELEQVMAIRGDTDTLATDAASASSTTTTTNNTTTGQTPPANQTQS